MEITKGKEKGFKECYDKNNDAYGRCTFDFAVAWADMMEEAIKSGKAVKDVAKGLSHVADEKYGISGFMYGCAVSVLTEFWIRGEELRKWHNIDTQINEEGEKANEGTGVLNPALLTIKEK